MSELKKRLKDSWKDKKTTEDAATQDKVYEYVTSLIAKKFDVTPEEVAKKLPKDKIRWNDDSSGSGGTTYLSRGKQAKEVALNPYLAPMDAASVLAHEYIHATGNWSRLDSGFRGHTAKYKGQDDIMAPVITREDQKKRDTYAQFIKEQKLSNNPKRLADEFWLENKMDLWQAHGAWPKGRDRPNSQLGSLNRPEDPPSRSSLKNKVKGMIQGEEATDADWADSLKRWLYDKDRQGRTARPYDYDETFARGRRGRGESFRTMLRNKAYEEE